MVKPHFHSNIKKTLGKDFNTLLYEISPYMEPRMDIYESDVHLIISLDLAGARKEDLSLRWINNILVIEGLIRNEYTEAYYKNIQNERFYGSFKREILISKNCEKEHIQANFINGILSIIIPLYREKIGMQDEGDYS
ncbi:Hsp20/alpha crystallin family protein [Oceanobacillus piezotolerans]|uniref:Hsp20/alpha crystallin family protein n=1 Tax=Oceanobacillus piezotolerans TaxID=2448030 RepID=UPI001314B1B8|nr:Hsp20/alpha crystallin family protein [Oceanobacillus piezotolerans]